MGGDIWVRVHEFDLGCCDGFDGFKVDAEVWRGVWGCEVLLVVLGGGVMYFVGI